MTPPPARRVAVRRERAPLRVRAVVTQVVTKRLGALPVVAEFLHRLRVAETVDELCPARDLALATHGEVIEALVANRLTSPRPLVRVGDWARTWAVKEVMQIDPELLNDDRLGRALDAIAPHLDQITGSIAAQAICEFGIDTATLHWGMTSMSLTGALDPENQDPGYPKVAYGHPKDRRVDLEQIQAGLGVSADGAVPLLATAISGGTGEITQVVSAIARFQKAAAVKRFLMIGDSKLVSYDNLTALSGAQVEFIAPLAASATDTAVFAALDPQAAKRVEYVPLRAVDRPTMERPDYRVLEDTHMDLRSIGFDSCPDASRTGVLRGGGSARCGRGGRMGTMADTFHTTTLEITTGTGEVALDITDRCTAFLAGVAGGRGGLLNVFVPHATCGIAVIETGAGSDEDLLAILQELLPADDRWRHRHGSPGHGRDHVLPAFVAPHATLPVVGGQLALGIWQSVVLVDTNRDNPRRTVRLSFLGG